MVAPNLTPPRTATPVPPSTSGSSTVVPIRPKPLAFTPMTRPVVIEEDVVEYLVKARPEQRWKILARVAAATADEVVAPPSASALPPASTAPPSPVASAPHVVARTLELLESPDVEPAIEEQEARPVAVPPPPAPPTPKPMPPRLSSAPPSVRQTRETLPAPAPPAGDVDPSEELFSAMAELSRIEGTVAGARFCLEAALRAVPCVAGVVHLRDAATHDMVVVHAQGPCAESLVDTRSKGDALITRASRTIRPTVVTYGAEPGAEQTICARHELFDPWSVVLVPVMHGGQLLGLIEMVDPVKGNPFDEDVQGALGYVAVRLGGFLAERA